MILFLSDTYEGSVHDKRIADGTPYPLPPGSTLLQDLGFLAFVLDGVESITPFKKPRGGALTDEQKAFNQRLARRRVRIEHVNSSVKRCRIVKDTIRLFKDGVRFQYGTARVDRQCLQACLRCLRHTNTPTH